MWDHRKNEKWQIVLCTKEHLKTFDHTFINPFTTFSDYRGGGWDELEHCWRDLKKATEVSHTTSSYLNFVTIGMTGLFWILSLFAIFLLNNGPCGLVVSMFVVYVVDVAIESGFLPWVLQWMSFWYVVYGLVALGWRQKFWLPLLFPFWAFKLVWWNGSVSLGSESFLRLGCEWFC